MITGQIKGTKLIINNISADASLYKPETSAAIFYEVVRVIDGKFLFLSDHLKRLEKSLQSSTAGGLDYPGHKRLKAALGLLISESDIESGNVKISIYKNEEGEFRCLVHFVSHFYPSAEMYRNGVKLLSFEHTRPQPGIKKWDGDFRKRVNEFIDNRNIYEAILLKENGNITEGSRSNIFFITRNDEVITPPADVVLPGITRKHIIEIIRKLHIPFRESRINLNNISDFRACFITGTSPKVLPVKTLDGVAYETQDPILKSIMDAFNILVEDNLELI